MPGSENVSKAQKENGFIYFVFLVLDAVHDVFPDLDFV
jgi:hypothetical protein